MLSFLKNKSMLMYTKKLSFFMFGSQIKIKYFFPKKFKSKNQGMEKEIEGFLF